MAAARAAAAWRWPGAADVVSAVFRNTIVQLTVPDPLRGRVNSLNIAVVTGGPRLGRPRGGRGAAGRPRRGSRSCRGGLACVAGVGVLGPVAPRTSCVAGAAPVASTLRNGADQRSKSSAWPPSSPQRSPSRGIHRPFPIQALTIPDAVAGRDVCGKAKTGSGKTLAFGLPLLQVVGDAEPGRPKAIVLVPTRELCIQVHDVLAPLGEVAGVRFAIVYGGAPLEKQVRVLQEGAEIVVATPGRMIDLLDRKALSLDDIEHVVLDEADRMADMGFLPQVEWILRHTKGRNQTLLFSATLDGAVKVLIDRYQHDPVLPRGRVGVGHRRGDDAPVRHRCTSSTR